MATIGSAPTNHYFLKAIGDDFMRASCISGRLPRQGDILDIVCVSAIDGKFLFKLAIREEAKS